MGFNVEIIKLMSAFTQSSVEKGAGLEELEELNPAGPQFEAPEAETPKQDQPVHRKHAFTLVHGFYAVMGGYVFDFSDDQEPPFLPVKRTRMVITQTGFRYLMRHAPDLVPDLSETSITDRASADWLSKSILFLQITWFCVNYVLRHAEHLPHSLLEVATLAHCLSTIITYFCWWSKPFNVQEPTLISGALAREVCALLAMCSGEEYLLLAEFVRVYCLPERSFLDERDYLEHFDPPKSEQYPIVLSRGSVLPGTTFAYEGRRRTDINLFDRLALHSLCGSWDLPWYRAIEFGKFTAVQNTKRITLQQSDCERWRLAGKALYSSKLSKPRLSYYVVSKSTMQYAGSTEFDDIAFRYFDIYTAAGIMLIILPAIYGLPHFLGWNARFPSAIERHLWHIACIFVTSAGLALSAVHIGSVYLVRHSIRKRSTRSGLESGISAFSLLVAALYILASGYLVVESLRQLLYLDPGAYQLPSWSNYWPHFS